MSNKEDVTLSNNLQKLEISESKTKLKTNFDVVNINPFMKRKRSKSLSSVSNLFGTNSCRCNKKIPRVRNAVQFKSLSKNKKVLREPILKLIYDTTKCCCEDDVKQFGECAGNTDKNFRSIVDACQQLSLANANDGVQDYMLPSFQEIRLAGKQEQQEQQSTDNVNSGSSNNNMSSSSCSQQARMNGLPPCDVTIDELASYFETFVHIPKKMSSMAEMMYI